MRKLLLVSLLGTLAGTSAHAVVNPLVQPPSVLQAAMPPGPATSPASSAPVSPPPLARGPTENPLLATPTVAANTPPDPLHGLPTSTRQQLVAAEVVVIFGQSAVLRVPVAVDSGAASTTATTGGAPTPIAPAAAGSSAAPSATTTSTGSAGGVKVVDMTPVREQSLMVQNGSLVWLGLTELHATVTSDRVILRLPGKAGRVVYVGSIEGTDRDAVRTTESAIAPKTSDYKSRRPVLEESTSATPDKK